MPRVTGLTVLAIAAIVSLASCGLFDDLTVFTVCTSFENISVDSGKIGVSVPAGTQLPSIPCTKAPDTCAQAAAQLSCGGKGYACTLECGAGGTCQAVGTFEYSAAIDIAQKMQSRLGSKAVSSVTLSRFEYTVPQNTLNFDTPAISLYVGPKDAQRVSDTGTALLATLPSLEAGKTFTVAKTINAEPAGQTALSTYVRNYKDPFRLLGQATLRFSAGQPLPMGQLRMDAQACFRVEPL